MTSSSKAFLPKMKLLFGLALLLITIPACGQSFKVQIKIEDASPPRALISGERDIPVTEWSLPHDYAGITTLANRVESFQLFEANGSEVQVRRLAPGEYETRIPAARFSYTVALDPPADPASAAHVSWLEDERALLALGDLLPATAERVNVRFVVPDGWRVYSSVSQDSQGAFNTGQAGECMFFAARETTASERRAGTIAFSLLAPVAWSFLGDEVAGEIASILKEHLRTMGGIEPAGKVLVVLTSFPRGQNSEGWSAETRGNTVVLLAKQFSSAVSARSYLATPLTHELFHLWIPKALPFDGDYAWFYEGFTRYQALRAAVRLRYLTFSDYEAAIAVAYEAYQRQTGQDDLSLMRASERRWTGSGSLIYNKGMLIAAIFDLTLRFRTSGRYSLDDFYRELMRRYHGSTRRYNGNTELLEAIDAYGGDGVMKGFAAQHIQRPFRIDIGAELAPFGFQTAQEGRGTRLIVAAHLTREQRSILRKLGYIQNA